MPKQGRASKAVAGRAKQQRCKFGGDGDGAASQNQIALATLLAAASLGRADAVRIMIPNQIRGTAERSTAYKNGGALSNRMMLREGPQALDAERLGRASEALHLALLQSNAPAPGEDGIIHVFPAWPKEWSAQYKLAALAFDRHGQLYISSRYDGMVYQATPNGNMSVYVEGMGVATGIAFDRDENLYVGDRSGTIFKISPSRQIFVFATLEPSIAAYHLAFGPDGYLYVSGPTTSSFDAIHRISQAGEVEVFYRGLGRPQGIAFDAEGRLYAAASISGRKGVVRIYPNGSADLFLSGPGIVGLAFTPSRAMVVATTNAIYRVDAGIKGLPLV